MSTIPTSDVTPAPAKAPAAAPATVVTGVLLALVLLGVGVVFLRDALLAAGAVTGTPWLRWFADKAELISASSPWMLWAGPVAVVIGLVLIVAALKPRKATHWAAEEPGVHIGRSDAARLVANAAHESTSVVAARADVSGRRALRVTARTVATDTNGVTAEVDRAVTHRLAALRPTPSIRTRVVTSSPKED
ncbi:DUF6286 domain-containing protein [Lapillicoccus jejuensis]|uniref:DUF6286 domain-containing protein n=1 Tax=Lapillicoccus jejuensis TaxID=402171 RepID=A0A542DZ05_9MICO|nr:DUF6286 domain-containing protein [Lapillicoccus jejuensis]TQJ08331.1 hypothetical protein FB458_1417 [Lapillicoccus jejuensis]